MDVGEAPPSGGSSRPSKPTGARWWPPALAGAAAFWLANFLISLTPAAAAYRSALSISYVPMLVEAALGGLIIGSAVAIPLVRFPDRIPGNGPLGRALLLGLGVLVLATVFLEVPAKLLSDAVEPVHWLVVAAVFNLIRIFALSLTVGLVTRRQGARTDSHRK